MPVNLDLFNKPEPPKPLLHDGYLFSAEEREANARHAYRNAVDAKGRKLGRKRGDERYDKIMADIAALNDSRFSVMRRESAERVAERVAELQAKFGQRLPKDAPIPEGKLF